MTNRRNHTQNSPKLEQTLTDLKEETESSKIMVGDTNIPFSIMDRISIHINKKTEDLNDTIKHLQLTSIYRTRYSMTAKYTYLSIVNGTLSRVDHMLSQKTSINTLKNTEVTYHISQIQWSG